MTDSTLVSAAPLEKSAAALALRFAPTDDRPALGSHLVIRRVVQMGEVQWVVKNPETVKYYKFGDGDWSLIEMFDGTRTVEEIRDEYNRRVPKSQIDLAFVLEYQDMLKDFEMLEERGARRRLALVEKFKTARKRAAEERAEGFNPFFLLFHVFDPNRFLDRTVKYVRWIWSPTTVAISSVFFLFTIAVFVMHWGPIWDGTIELYAFLKRPLIDVIQFFLLLSIIGFIHEFGHAYATKIYGGEVHDIGIALLYFTPAFYCDTTDSLLFQNKWHQLWVTIAGIYVEAFICSAATLAWVFSYPDTLLHELAYKTMLFTGISTVFFNINPLIKIDGYHALSSVLEISELREESFRYLGALFQRHILRLNVPIPPASRRKRRIYWIYGTLALMYLTTIMAFIGGLFYNFYSRYFPNVAVVLLILTMSYIFRKRVRLLTRISRLFIVDKKELAMSQRMRIPLLLSGLIFFLFLSIPWPRRVIRTEAQLAPAQTAQVQAPADGTVSSVGVSEGDLVRAGQEIVKLNSPAIESRIAALSSEREGFARQASEYRRAAAAAPAFESERLEAATAGMLRSEEAQQQRLEIRSPLTGRVLTSRIEDLEGKFVRSGAVLTEIGETGRLRADLLVSERMLGDVRPGAPVRLQLRARPWQIVHGSIITVSPATLTGAIRPAGMGENLRAPGRPDQFVAVALFDNPDGRLVPNMLGQAKIYGPHVSYLAQLWRGSRRWVQTMFW